MLCLYEKIKLLSRLCFLIYTLNSNFMSNVVFWRQVFLGASLFLCDGYPIIAAEVGDLTPNVELVAYNKMDVESFVLFQTKPDQL